MRLYPDPASLTPDERFRELACILAAGLLRRRARPPLSSNLGERHGPKKSPESDQDCLEVPAETVLSVHTS
jgi:hypothetical protein